MPINKIKNDSIPTGEITAGKFHQNGATDGQALIWSSANNTWQPGAGGGGGMSDIVDDTSPQLGGDLDLNAKNIVGNGNIDINGHFHGINIELETIEPTLQFKRLNNANVPAIKWLGQAGVEGANIKFDGTSGNANQLIFETYDSTTLAERFRITYDGANVTGKLGIGTSSPSQNLHISSSDHTRALITGGTDKYAELQFENDAQKFAMGVQDDDKFFLYNSTGTSQVLTIDTSNNVGIGTQTPGEKLVVHGDGARITVESDDYEVAMLGRRGSSGSALDSGYLRLRRVGVTNDGVVLDTNGNSWLNGGNVGIGTATPTAGKLHVDGGTNAIGLHVSGSNTTDTRIQLNNTSASALYTYLQLSTSGVSEGDGYVIKNMNQGNALPQGHLYLWNSGGTDNAISMVPNGDITKRATFNTDGSMTLRGTGGVEGHGMKLLSTVEWTSGTAGAVFPVVDHSKYSAYQFYWVCDHAPNWFHTYLRLQDANGTVTNNIYHNNTSWKNSNSNGGTPDHNNASYYGQRTHCWMAGNGTGYMSHGMGLMSFEGSLARVLIRGISQLSNRSSTDHYEESWSSTVDMVPSGVTGFTIYGSGGNSNRGYIKVFGIEK